MKKRKKNKKIFNNFLDIFAKEKKNQGRYILAATSDHN